MIIAWPVINKFLAESIVLSPVVKPTGSLLALNHRPRHPLSLKDPLQVTSSSSRPPSIGPPTRLLTQGIRRPSTPTMPTKASHPPLRAPLSVLIEVQNHSILH